MDFDKLSQEEIIQLSLKAGFIPDLKELPAIPGYLDAAVLILLSWIDKQWQVILTRRTNTVSDHKGQVAFPGGAKESVDQNLLEAALREAKEEIGVAPEDVDVFGMMKPMLTISNFRITPFIGFIQHPYPFTPAMDEVERIFYIPINWIASNNNWSLEWVNGLPDGSRRKVVRYKPYNGEVLWGISAMFLQEFLHGINNTR